MIKIQIVIQKKNLMKFIYIGILMKIKKFLVFAIQVANNAMALMIIIAYPVFQIYIYIKENA